MRMFKEFWEEEEAFALVELLVIMAVLIVIAIIFRKAIVKWVTDTVNSLFGTANDAINTDEAEGYTPDF